MNRDIALEASLALALAFLIVTWAAFRSPRPPGPGAMRRGGIAAVLVYAVLAVPVLASSGLALAGLLVLLVVMGLAFLAAVFALDRSRTAAGAAAPESAVERSVRFAVSTGITAVLLISAGQTLSLLSRLDPRIIVLAITVVAGYLVYAQQLAATHRIGSTAMWFMIVPVVLSLAVGFYLGGLGVLASPVRLVDGLSASAGVGIAVVMIVIGWADNTLRTSALVGRWSRPRTLGGALLIVALIVIGVMMLLGGAVLVPSMEFFTIPANLDMLPGLAGLMLMILTILFTALVAHALLGGGPGRTPGRSRAHRSQAGGRRAEQRVRGSAVRVRGGAELADGGRCRGRCAGRVGRGRAGPAPARRPGGGRADGCATGGIRRLRRDRRGNRRRRRTAGHRCRGPRLVDEPRDRRDRGRGVRGDLRDPNPRPGPSDAVGRIGALNRGGDTRHPPVDR